MASESRSGVADRWRSVVVPRFQLPGMYFCPLAPGIIVETWLHSFIRKMEMLFVVAIVTTKVAN